MSDKIELLKGRKLDIKDRFLAEGSLNELDFNREFSFMVQQAKDNTFLLKDLEGLLKIVVNVAQTGLSLNPTTKLAYIVPRGGKVCLDPSYRGLAKLVTDTGSVNAIEVHLIYEGDDIEIDMASDEKIKKHVPYTFTANEKGALVGAYSLAILATGDKHFEYMSREDIEFIRGNSESYKRAESSGKLSTNIWVKYEGEMFRKTVLKRHTKYLPRTDRFAKLEKAIDLDNYAAGFDIKPTWNQIDYATSIIEQVYDPETSDMLVNKLQDCDINEYRNIVKQCERDKGLDFDNGNVSAKAISEKLDQKMQDDRA